SIWRSGSSRNSASRSPSRRSAGSCAPWATANSRPDRATMRKRKARLRILKKLSRAPGGNRARQGARLRHDRNLVRRRGSHRPEEQDHPALGDARRPPQRAPRPAYCLHLHLRRSLPEGGQGLRRGEIAALRWRHIDFDAGHISIEQSAEQTHAGVRYKPPKSGRARTVEMGATVAAELRAHRLAQVQALLSIGVRLTDDSFVVMQADGSPVQPNTLTHNWVIECAKIGLPRIRFHDMRHTHATHLLASGVHPKVASERLGHSKVALTLHISPQVLPNMQADAAALVDDALQAALQSRTKKNKW